jgi:hypothetical protein
MPAARTAVNGPANGGKLEVKTARIRQDNAVAVAQGNTGLNGDPRLRLVFLRRAVYVQRIAPNRPGCLNEVSPPTEN